MNIFSRALINVHRFLWKIPYEIYRYAHKYPNLENNEITYYYNGTFHKTYRMFTENDCETIAIANASCGMYSYKEIEDALLRVTGIGLIENPLFGNPWNVEIALEKLCIEYENINPWEITPEDSVILLTHSKTFDEDKFKHIFYQHWIAHSPGTDVNIWHYGDSCRFICAEDIYKLWKCNLYSRCIRLFYTSKKCDENIG